MSKFKTCKYITVLLSLITKTHLQMAVINFFKFKSILTVNMQLLGSKNRNNLALKKYKSFY